ncbi:hypothetical protein MCOR16_005377 [Pyricularia oryzae]|nr:hypothetical protein MCOR16_005377 [Pyricularia oryzae]
MQWNEFVLVEELTESSGTVIMGTSETRDVAHGIVILPVAIDNVYNVHCVNITSGCTYDTEADRLVLSCIVLCNHTLGQFSRRLLFNCSDISIREKQRADVIKLCRLNSTEEIHSRVLVDLFVPRCFGRTNSGEQVANRVDTLKSLSIRSRTSSTSRSMSVSGQEGSSSDGASSLSCSLHWFHSPRDERVVHEDHLIQRLKQLGDKPKPPDSFRKPTCLTEVIVQ